MMIRIVQSQFDNVRLFGGRGTVGKTSHLALSSSQPVLLSISETSSIKSKNGCGELLEATFV
jgi:hypothetical protein